MSRRVSYAQDGEDVVLHRVLQDLPAVTYAVVGAGHPVVDSVSASLHGLGWRGIHVEPVPSYVRGLREQRPGDVVVECAVGAADGVQPFWFVPDSGLSTLSAERAERARRDGWVVNESSVPVRRLADVLDEHLAGRELHALVVDVGGAEEDVLQGADLARHRPWVLVVRASSAGAAPFLTDLGYAAALFDGVNQWYLSGDHAELRDRTTHPACSADGWVRAGLAFPDAPDGGAPEVASSAALHLAAAVSRRQAAEVVAAEARTQLAELRAELKALRAQSTVRVRDLERALAKERGRVQAMEQSSSWRVTRPIRSASSLARRRKPPSG